MNNHPSAQRYREAGPEDAISVADVRRALDSHGLRIPKDVGHGCDAKTLQLVYNDWVRMQRIDPSRQYLLPLRTAWMYLREFHPPVTAWRVLVDAINDPDAGLQIVRLRYSRRAA